MAYIKGANTRAPNDILIHIYQKNKIYIVGHFMKKVSVATLFENLLIPLHSANYWRKSV